MKNSESKEAFVEIKSTKSKEKIKQIFYSWSQSVTFHCFPKIFKAETNFFILRFFWSFIFLSFSSFTFFILVSNVIAYYQYETTTSFQIINEQPSLFPAITICDSNAFTTKKAESLILNMSKEFYGIDLTKLPFSKYYDYVTGNLTQVVKSYVSDPKYGDENRQQLGFNLSQLMTSCVFNQVSCNFNEDFHWFFHYDFGNCFQLNSGLNMKNQVVGLKKVSFGAKDNGLSVQIGPLVNQNQYPLTSSKGLKIFIHNSTKKLKLFDNSLSLEPGKETNVVIERKITLNLPWPYSECIDLSNGYNSEFYNVLIRENLIYSQFECLGMCIIQKPIEEACKCFYAGIPSFKSSTACTNLTQILCFNDKYRKQLDNLNYYAKECIQYSCPLECVTYTYNTQLTSLEYPSIEFYHLALNDTTSLIYTSQYKDDLIISTYESFRQYFYSLNFYYSSTQYTYISESPQMTPMALLSNLGGSLGMFLGLSVFSLLEIFEIVTKIFWAWVFRI